MYMSLTETLSGVILWQIKTRVKLTFLMTEEGHLRVFHINFPPKTHPTEAVDHISLPVLGNGVCVTSNGELKGRIRDVMKPFITVETDLFMNLLVRCSRGV